MKVFVYGTLKKGYGNSYLLESSTYLGKHTTEEEYTMYSLGAFPAIMHSGDTSITGEVYEIDDSTLTRLDTLEGYPHLYSREVIATPYGDAWVYSMVANTYLLPNMIVESGVWGA